MPRTPPTICCPLPNDPRVLALAKASGLTSRESFSAAAEAWAWMLVMAVDDIVNASVDSLDSVVGVSGFGAAMLETGLVGTVDGGLVLPAELRRHERDQRGGRGAAEAGDRDDSQLRRKALNAESARRYRRKKRVTGSASKSDATKPRSLGHVAGHEVRVFEGQYGPYAMLLGATLGGEPYKKLTTGDKTWAIGSVTLAEVLPGLVQKWQAVHDREKKIHDPSKRKILDPSFEALRAAAASHADGADASSRHADASALASSSADGSSADKSRSGNSLDAPGASSQRHADALSSMSSISSVSLSSLEEKRETEERVESEIKERTLKLGFHKRMKFDAQCAAARDRWFVAKFVAGEHKRIPDPDAVAADLGLPKDKVMATGLRECWVRFRRQALSDIEASAGDIPTNGLHEPAAARGDASATTEPTTDDKPAAGSVDACDEDAFRGDEDPDRPRHDSWDTLKALKRHGIPPPTLMAAPGRGRRLDDDAFEHGEQTSVVSVDAGHGR